MTPVVARSVALHAVPSAMNSGYLIVTEKFFLCPLYPKKKKKINKSNFFRLEV